MSNNWESIKKERIKAPISLPPWVIIFLDGMGCQSYYVHIKKVTLY